VSAYRVIQEALTNALKHSGSSTASIRLVYKPDLLEVEVHDDGHGRVGSTVEQIGGHGLLGMRERVGLHGGHLSAGQTAEGFAVRATFPVNGNAG
jgi:signal transduction histidine kinase